MADIKQHPWFQHHLPEGALAMNDWYLTKQPNAEQVRIPPKWLHPRGVSCSAEWCCPWSSELQISVAPLCTWLLPVQQ